MKKTKERTFRIGRARDCDIVLADDSVSRHHAELSFIDGGKLFLTDCHSANGTAIVAGDREIPVRQTSLSPTETVRFGDLVLSVKELLEAVRLKFPDFSGGPERESEAESQPRPGPGDPWVRHERLVRCPACGSPKPAGALCGVCGG
jgi:pSer/pThr/pTyr-binding forkhead associated (FHA) protein